MKGKIKVVNMINYDKVISNLKGLKGRKFNKSEIEDCFKDAADEDITDEVAIDKCMAWSSPGGEGSCRLYNAYVWREDEPIFQIGVDECNKIVSIINYYL